MAGGFGAEDKTLDGTVLAGSSKANLPAATPRLLTEMAEQGPVVPAPLKRALLPPPPAASPPPPTALPAPTFSGAALQTAAIGNYLLLAEAVLFFGLFWLIHARLRGEGGPEAEPAAAAAGGGRELRLQRRRSLASSSGSRIRRALLSVLALGVAFRGLSLLIICWELRAGSAGASAGPRPISAEWLVLFLRTAPSLVFIAGYSLLVLFWAHLHYNTARALAPGAPGRGARAAVWAAAAGVFAAYAAAAAYAELRGRGPQTFATFAALLLAGLYLTVAVFVQFFGVKIVAMLAAAPDTGGHMPRAALVRRMVLISFLCPLFFVGRGALELCAAAGWRLPERHARFAQTLWFNEAFQISCVYALTEFVPVALVLRALWPFSTAPPEASAAESCMRAPLLPNESEARASEVDAYFALPVQGDGKEHA